MTIKDVYFHPRRSDREIKNAEEIDAIIGSQKYMTIAMCSGNEPYLATLSFGYDKELKCLYFHCATEGKKLAILKKNPVVWGQIVQDRGYLKGECSHAYSSVQFRGVVTILDDIEEKQRALSFMICQLEADPAPIKERLVMGKDLSKVVVGRIEITAFSGKKAH